MPSLPLRDRLRKLRLEAGLSQRALCRKIDVDESYISRLERGQRAPSVEVLRRWADACGVEVAVLDPAAGLADLVAALRPADVDRVRRYAEALARLPADLPAGPRHPGDIGLAVVEAAASVTS
jgi:transcriptional regulator with XRE-family HTH domain